MKIIKPIFCLLFLSLIFTACSKDDDGNNEDYSEFTKKIVGTWRLFEVVEEGELVPMGECLPQSTIKFEKGNTFITNSVSDDFDFGCIEETSTGQWKYLGEGELEVILEDNGEAELAQITFSKNDSIFTITENTEDATRTSYIKID